MTFIREDTRVLRRSRTHQPAVRRQTWQQHDLCGKGCCNQFGGRDDQSAMPLVALGLPPAATQMPQAPASKSSL